MFFFFSQDMFLCSDLWSAEVVILLAGLWPLDKALCQMTSLVMSEEVGWHRLGRGAGRDIGQLTMLVAGKRILPRLFKQGISCCLISALCSRVLRSPCSMSSTLYRFALWALIWYQPVKLFWVWFSYINSLFCVWHCFVDATSFVLGQRGMGLCSH